jgi:CspA family cold shock protein
MSKGKVKYFNDLRGWGLIGNEEVEQDVYVHYTAIQMDGFRTLKQGQDVLFQLTEADGELRATEVVPA